MIFLITGISALEFWLCGSGYLHLNCLSFDDRKLVALPSSYQLLTNPNQVKAIAREYCLFTPVLVMADNKMNRRHNFLMHSQVMPAHIPRKSFIQLDNGVYICSPEFSFLLNATAFSLPKLIEIANNLCAQYVTNLNARFQQLHRAPLTHVNEIDRFLKASEKVNGLSSARRAIQYASNGANSPMESKLAVLIMLPLHCGGYALPRPLMNFTIKLTSQKAKDLLGCDSCCCDFVWLEEKVILEYDSNLSHLDKKQHSFDKRKYMALTLSGYKVISVTADQISNFKNVEQLFDLLRVSLGVQSRKERMERFKEKRWETVHELLFSKDCFSEKHRILSGL